MPSHLSTQDKIEEWQDIVAKELTSASCTYPRFNSAHEGFAIMQEEMEELFDAVKLKQVNPERPCRMRKEAVQVAAMALRFLVDLCEVP